MLKASRGIWQKRVLGCEAASVTDFDRQADHGAGAGLERDWNLNFLKRSFCRALCIIWM